jgi:hypothetical protein
MTQLASPIGPMSLLADRGLETLIGAAVGITVVLLMRDRVSGAASHRWKTPRSV